jgi:hypothetical protein
MFSRLAFLGMMVILAEGVAAAHCRPGYIGSGYYRDSSCREFLIPRTYPSDTFYSFYSGPMFYAAPFGPPVIVLPPRNPGWYYRPFYFDGARPYRHWGRGKGRWHRPHRFRYRR